VDVNLSSVNFMASPWNEPLQDVKVNVSPSAGIIQTSQGGSSLFVLTSNHPVQFNYSLDISGGHDLARGAVTINARYQTQTDKLSMAKLIVRVLGDQSSPVAVDVTGTQGVSVTRSIVGSNRALSFILPGGSYTVTASQAGDSQSAQVALTDGVATTVNLSLGTLPTLETILVVTAVIAAVANVLVWVFRSRSLSSRMATSPKDASSP
jgi:hypothetical protein